MDLQLITASVLFVTLDSPGTDQITKKLVRHINHLARQTFVDHFRPPNAKFFFK